MEHLEDTECKRRAALKEFQRLNTILGNQTLIWLPCTANYISQDQLPGDSSDGSVLDVSKKSSLQQQSGNSHFVELEGTLHCFDTTISSFMQYPYSI